jgi:protein-S-isoprenylcysteine O-methyltransferase Ste14
MFVGVYQSIVTVLLAVAFYGGDVLLMRRFDPARVEGSSRSWSWTAFAAVIAAIVVAQPVAWPDLGYYAAGWWALAGQMAGLMLMAGGLALHWWARLHLRHYYGERVEFQAGQQLVETGPYRYVRHPIYSSFFLCIVGLLLVNPAVTTMAATLYFFWDFPRAARGEEEMLADKLPGYRDYMARTPRYVPRLSLSRPRHPEQSPGQ